MRSGSIALVLLAVVFASMSVSAQKGGKAPKPPFKWPGEAQFRSNCDLTGPPDAPCVPLDPNHRIIGDGSDYRFVPEQGGAGMYSVNGNLHIALSQPAYRLRLDFSEPLDVAPCLSGGTPCRRNFSGPIVLETAEVQGAVVDADGNRVDNGLWSIPQGGFGRSQLRVGFRTADGTLFNVRFQAALYAGATDVDVQRTGKCQWVFTADEHAVAGLNAWGSSPTAKGNQNVTTNEGLFRMPTRITLDLVHYSSIYPLPAECT
jgi:hypothetical protein